MEHRFSNKILLLYINQNAVMDLKNGDMKLGLFVVSMTDTDIKNEGLVGIYR
ncbi:hypothetical protein [Oceanobacillus neutriphilus]|uniref:hypothetical protein n=1 Tax=Oceanobacillus neutriphilus TaxID=531815 RepID=UPI001E509856|nr:hypothetical protein [Oceanobacillus neutriphilus]